MTVPLRAVAVAAGGAALVVVALAFDTSPLFVPGVAFLAIGALTPALVWCSAAGAQVRRLPGEREVTEGVRFKTTVLVRAGPLGLYGAQLHDPLCGTPVTLSASPYGVGGSEARVEIVASFPRRGRKRLEPPALRVADPIGLAPVFRRGSDRLELLVVPRTEPVNWTRSGGAGNRHTPAHGLLPTPSRPAKSTDCARTGPERRPRGSTGPPWLGGRVCWNAECAPNRNRAH